MDYEVHPCLLELIEMVWLLQPWFGSTAALWQQSIDLWALQEPHLREGKTVSQGNNNHVRWVCWDLFEICFNSVIFRQSKSFSCPNKSCIYSRCQLNGPFRNIFKQICFLLSETSIKVRLGNFSWIVFHTWQLAISVRDVVDDEPWSFLYFRCFHFLSVNFVNLNSKVYWLRFICTCYSAGYMSRSNYIKKCHFLQKNTLYCYL